MSKKIKQFTADIDALDIDESVKEMLKAGVSGLNDEFKTEITRTKTKLNDGFESEKSDWEKKLEELKKPATPTEPNKEILDQLELLKRELSAEKELRESAEKARTETKIKTGLSKLFEGSIDADLLSDKYLNKFKMIDGKLFTNDDDLTPATDFIENLKVEKASWWGAVGNGGNGNGGKAAPAPKDLYTMEQIDGMSEKAIIANMDKVDRSMAYHAKN